MFTYENQLAFTAFLENLTPMVDLVQILAGLGVVTAMMAYLKRMVELRRWERFRQRAEKRIDQLRYTENRHPGDLSEQEWKMECERMLTDVGFPPLDVNQILDTAVVVAKGIAADKFFM